MSVNLTAFVDSLITGGGKLGLSGWFNGLASLLILLTIVWAATQVVYGNPVGGRAALVRAMVALLLYNLTTNVNPSIQSTLWGAWKSVHTQATKVLMGPVTNALGQSLVAMRDSLKRGILIAGAFSLTTAVSLAWRGRAAYKAVQEARESANETKAATSAASNSTGGSKMAKAMSGIGLRTVYQVTAILAVYIATIMAGAVLAYFSLALLPLGAALVSIGQERFLSALLSAYIASVLLAAGAPLVASASFGLVKSINLAQINRNLREALNEAERLQQEQARVAEQIEQEIRNIPDPTKQNNNQNKNLVQRIRDAVANSVVGQWVGNAVKVLEQGIRAIMAPIDRMLTSFSTWLVTSVVSIVLFAIMLIAVVYGAKQAFQMLTGLLKF